MGYIKRKSALMIFDKHENLTLLSKVDFFAKKTIDIHKKMIYYIKSSYI